MAGVPPLAGFMGKALLLQAAGHTPLGRLGGGSGAGIQPGHADGAGPCRVNAVLEGPGAGATAAGTGATASRQRSWCWPCWLAVLATAAFAGPLAAYTQAAAQQLVQRQGLHRSGAGRPTVPAGLRRAPRDARAGEAK
jgi:multicomponent K+:H+ antiporter subunit D